MAYANRHALQPEPRRPLTLEPHSLDGPSEQADYRAATTGMMLADLECDHGQLGDCEECSS